MTYPCKVLILETVSHTHPYRDPPAFCDLLNLKSDKREGKESKMKRNEKRRKEGRRQGDREGGNEAERERESGISSLFTFTS